MATFNDQLKEIECFLLEWKEEMNCQFEELRECLRPILNRGVQESSEISRNSRDTSNCDSGHSTMELEVGEEATQPDAMEDKSLTILGPILEDSSGEFSGVDGTDERQSTSLLFEPPILQSAVFNGDAMGLNRPSFLEGFKSENPSNPRLNPTPSNIGVRLNRVELGNEDHGVNGSRVLHTEMNNTMEDLTQEIVPTKVAQVGDGLFLDAHNLLEEMPMGDGSAKLQEMGDFESLKVTSLPLLKVSDCEYENMSEWVVDPVEPIGFSRGDVNIASTGILSNFSAHKVFVRMLGHAVFHPESIKISLVLELPYVADVDVYKNGWEDGISVFDPGITFMSLSIDALHVSVMVFIRYKIMVGVWLSNDHSNWVFDPGGDLRLKFLFQLKLYVEGILMHKLKFSNPEIFPKLKHVA